eukprot:TRINITY_DN5535_c0_g1_i1.p1 TRINITY_DN5535_c0_g1~~TRINITY_DN5535_c0_g1_i1.p1  ORF type:complete len:486 (-),score=89.32 TRINITY_DN5535_c0_g1_i1:168-1589(-)
MANKQLEEGDNYNLYVSSPNLLNYMNTSPKTGRKTRTGGTASRQTGGISLFKKKDLRKSSLSNTLSYLDEPENIKFSLSEPEKITAISLEKIIELLTQDPVPSVVDPEFRETFFLTYHSVASPVQVMEALNGRFISQNYSRPSKDVYSASNQSLQTIRVKALGLIKVWLTHHYYDFVGEPKLWAMLNDLLDITKESMPRVSQGLLDFFKRKSQKQKEEQLMDSVGSTSPSPGSGFGSMGSSWVSVKRMSIYQPSASKTIKLTPENVNEVSFQLCLLEQQMFNAITPPEWLSKPSLRASNAPNLSHMSHRTQIISDWVQSEIDSQPSIEEKLKSFQLFLSLAQRLRDLNNFHGLHEVVNGLQKPSEELAEADPESVAKFKELSDVFNPDNKFRNYHNIISLANAPLLPSVAIVTTVLNEIEGNSLDYEEQLINWIKRKRFAEVLRSLNFYQLHPYPFTENQEMKKWLSTVSVQK